MGVFFGDVESGKEVGFFYGGFYIFVLDVVMCEIVDKGIVCVIGINSVYFKCWNMDFLVMCYL